jgi:GDP-4-dehydro-6-deoxy-D-mannose reductase
MWLNKNHHQPILITGGTGFVGSHLVEALLAQGETNIHVTTYRAADAYTAKLISSDHIHPIDLTDQKAAAELIQQLQPTQIYHLAAFATVGKSFDNTYHTLQNNLLLQYSVLEAVKQHAPQARILIIGSGMEYDFLQLAKEQLHAASENSPIGPVSPYAISKVLQDLLGLSYFYSYQLNTIRVRPFNHIGERQSPDFAIPSFAKQIVAIERGEQTELKVGNLDAVRDFTDVKDVVNAYILLMKQGQVGEVYNVGSGRGFPVAEILAILCSLAKQEIRIAVDADRIRPLDIESAIADISKIQELGWQPKIELRLTLQRILDYWRKQ